MLLCISCPNGITAPASSNIPYAFVSLKDLEILVFKYVSVLACSAVISGLSASASDIDLLYICASRKQYPIIPSASSLGYQILQHHQEENHKNNSSKKTNKDSNNQ